MRALAVAATLAAAGLLAAGCGGHKKATTLPVATRSSPVVKSTQVDKKATAAVKAALQKQGGAQLVSARVAGGAATITANLKPSKAGLQRARRLCAAAVRTKGVDSAQVFPTGASKRSPLASC